MAMKLKTKEQLPFKYFVVKNDGSPEFKEYLDWLKREYNEHWDGYFKKEYYGYDGNRNFKGTNCWTFIAKFENNPKVFESAKEFMELLKEDEFPKDDFGIIVENINGKEILNYLRSKGFRNDYFLTGTAYNNSYYYIESDSKIIACNNSKNPTSKTYTLKELKQLENNMEKKIIGYKAPYDLFNGRANKDAIYTKIGDFYSPTHESLTRLDVAPDTVRLPQEIVETWEPVYEPKEIVVNMGSFELKVTKDGIFHRTENIRSFVKDLVDAFSFLNKEQSYGVYKAIVKDIVFSKTGCENSETKLSQWLKVWEEYQKIIV